MPGDFLYTKRTPKKKKEAKKQSPKNPQYAILLNR
jgi:hypothetical protein